MLNFDNPQTPQFKERQMTDQANVIELYNTQKVKTHNQSITKSPLEIWEKET